MAVNEEGTRSQWPADGLPVGTNLFTGKATGTAARVSQPMIPGEPRQLKQLVPPKPTRPGAFRGLARTPQFISFEGARAVRTALS